MSNAPGEGKVPPGGTAPYRTTPAPPPTIIVNTQGSRFSRFLAWFGWGAFFLCLVVIIGMRGSKEQYYNQKGDILEKYHSLSETASNKVAILDISGVIAQGEGSFAKKQIDAILEDESVKAVVVRVNSPGGTITGSDYIYHHLCQLRDERNLPIVVSMGGMAASGGYYVSMAVGDTEDSIFAERTTTTGSIGVIIPHYDISGLMERYDIQDDSVVSGPDKQLLSMTRPATPEHREMVQAYVDEAYEDFLEIIKQGRPQFRDDEAKLRELATGRIFDADSAEENGLVDQIGYLEDAVQRAIELASLSKSNVRVVKYEQPATFMGALTGAQAHGPEQRMAALFDMTTPRAWYVFTSFPPVVSSWEQLGR